MASIEFLVTLLSFSSLLSGKPAMVKAVMADPVRYSLCVSPVRLRMYSFLLVSVVSAVFAGVQSATFAVVNNCSYTVWPGILSSAGIEELSTTGFVLLSGGSTLLNVPTSWSGRLWGRTYCSQDSDGNFSCATADCGSGTVECSGAGAVPPATLAEFTLNGGGGLDFYDVSLVDGYNLGILITPQGETIGNCTSAGCFTDLNKICPPELRVTMTGVDGIGQNVACKSACEAFGEPEYCCSGEYSNPNTCKPTTYSEIFKDACPLAYSYAYDDGSSTFTCSSPTYIITFCPSTTPSSKSTNGQYPEAVDFSGRSHFTTPPFIGFLAVVLSASWKLAQR